MSMFDKLRRVPVDTRTPEEIAVDEEYNGVIRRVLGQEALDADATAAELLADHIPVGGMTIVDDGSDLGYVVPHEPSDEEKAAYARQVMPALRRSYDAIPHHPDEA